MKSAVFAIVLLQVSFALCGSTIYNPLIIKKVNHNPQSTWVAGENKFFEGRPIEDFKKLLGYKEKSSLNVKVGGVKADLPAQFDSATQWPSCETIGTIYNQADCGACWAFGAVEAISDRFCIASNGKVNEILSFMDMVTCGPDDGCEGGDPDDAFNYAQQSGLVTGTCSPYTIPTCPPQQQPCLNFVNTPNCVQQCNDTEKWNSSLHFLSNAYDVSSDQNAIMTEIMTNGPVEACFSVYADFVTYKSGVYQYQSGDYLGGHCIKIIGWGVENGTPYWLCNNSWTTYWGDNGQFKILRGQDECGIEDQVVAGFFFLRCAKMSQSEMPTVEEVNAMSKSELIDLAKELGVSSSGNKDVVLARVLDAMKGGSGGKAESHEDGDDDEEQGDEEEQDDEDQEQEEEDEEDDEDDDGEEVDLDTDVDVLGLLVRRRSRAPSDAGSDKSDGDDNEDDEENQDEIMLIPADQLSELAEDDDEDDDEDYVPDDDEDDDVSSKDAFPGGIAASLRSGRGFSRLVALNAPRLARPLSNVLLIFEIAVVLFASLVSRDAITALMSQEASAAAAVSAASTAAATGLTPNGTETAGPAVPTTLFGALLSTFVANITTGQVVLNLAHYIGLLVILPTLVGLLFGKYFTPDSVLGFALSRFAVFYLLGQTQVLTALTHSDFAVRAFNTVCAVSVVFSFWERPF